MTLLDSITVVDSMPTTFMEVWFPNLPLHLQNEIINKTYRIPPSKFKRGTFVRFKDSYIEEMKINVNKSRGREPPIVSWSKFPFGRLIIDEEPYWSSRKNEWMYNYIYGHCGLSEGCACESNLIGCLPGFI